MNLVLFKSMTSSFYSLVITYECASQIIENNSKKNKYIGLYINETQSITKVSVSYLKKCNERIERMRVK